VDEGPIVTHYAKTLAMSLSTTLATDDHEVHWYELAVEADADRFIARLIAHLSELDVSAQSIDENVFLAVRGVFESLARRLRSLGEQRGQATGAVA
jgi:ribosome-associated translation inhibitor RaiA